MSIEDVTPPQLALLVGAHEAGKRCRRCEQVKPRAEFHSNPNTTDRLHSYCSPCAREAKRRSYERWSPQQRRQHRDRVTRNRYGVGVDFIEALYEQQDGRCAVCQEPGAQPAVGEKRSSRAGVLCIDHDHETGQVRGLLCTPCNLGLGYFKDNVSTLGSAARYILRKGVN